MKYEEQMQIGTEQMQMRSRAEQSRAGQRKTGIRIQLIAEDG